MSKVIIAEDDENILGLLSDTLEAYTIIRAKNGEEAYKAFTGHEVDLIVTDLAMPVMDGHQLINAIRQSNQAIPIIVVSGFVNEIDKLASISRDDILEKPIEFER